MNANVSYQLRMSAGGRRAPITVRSLVVHGLAANGLVRGGSIEVDAIRARERAVSWLALAMLLGAWNVEARLDDATARSESAGGAPPAARSALEGFDWTESRPTRWTSCAGRDPGARGAGT